MLYLHTKNLAIVTKHAKFFSLEFYMACAEDYGKSTKHAC